MTLQEKFEYGLMYTLGAVAAIYLIRKLKQKLAERDKARKYSVFSKPPLADIEVSIVKDWAMSIPSDLGVTQHIYPDNPKAKNNNYDDYELRLTFNENESMPIRFVKSYFAIPKQTEKIQYRYFEVEVLSNETQSEIYVGVISDQEPFENVVNSISEMAGNQM